MQAQGIERRRFDFMADTEQNILGRDRCARLGGLERQVLHTLTHLTVEVQHVEGFADDLDLDGVSIHVLASASRQHLSHHMQDQRERQG